MIKIITRSIWVSFFLVSGAAAQAQYLQQGPKLVGTGAVGSTSSQGVSAAMSADGATAIIGGFSDNADVGAAWVFTRSGGVWSQQGAKLVGGGAVGGAEQGGSVALSGDGNTAIIGGYRDNSSVGAAWVFTRSGGAWSQQGLKLVGTGGVGPVGQGLSVALSADGNTAMVGGMFDNSSVGAAWVFTRSGGVWRQQGAKLVGTGGVGASFQGASVALSADGNTAIVGGKTDNSFAGAVWIYTRSGEVWSQQGPKLVGTGAVGGARQGTSVALSADGNTAIVGGENDDTGAGAAWVFTRSGGVWSEQGGKFLGTGAVGRPGLGMSVALSADGATAIVGGPYDNLSTGAAWVYTRKGGTWLQRGPKITGLATLGRASVGQSVALSDAGDTALLGGFSDNSQLGAAWAFSRRGAHDFDGNSTSDTLWRDTSGWLAMSFGNVPLVGIQLISFVLPTWTVVGVRDFDGDGKADILWRNANGDLALWLMNGTTYVGGAGLGNVPTSWTIAGVGDFDGDGRADVLWRGPNGEVVIWFMSGATVTFSPNLGTVSLNFTIAALGDLNGDGRTDIVWRDAAGNVYAWFMDGAALLSGPIIGAAPASWQIAGTADFNADGKADILWRGPAGEVAAWMMNGATIIFGPLIGSAPLSWSIQATGDFNNDGRTDILWRDTTGLTAVWYMDSATIASGPLIGQMPTSWTIQNANAD